MSLFIKKITSYFKDMKSLEIINTEAFPEDERMNISEMIQLINEKKIEVSALYDNEVFIGFYALTIKKPIAYVLFLAICSTKRSQGYGRKALALMKEQYADCQLVLDMEIIDETSENIKQRKLRKKFYLRNGFYETGFFMEYKGLTMEVLCSEQDLNKDAFQVLLENLKIMEIPFRLFPMNTLY